MPPYLPELQQMTALVGDMNDRTGFVPDLGRKHDAGVESGLLRGLHAVLVARDGVTVLERYYEGVDESWGAPLGKVAFGPDVLHDLRSVTKSVVGLLYGIALDRGLVPRPHASLYAAFPEYSDLLDDPRRRAITVAHTLSMTMGLDWNEDLPYTDPKNSEIAMEQATDRNRYALERPVVSEPGSNWVYSGGAVALIGALIARGAGKPLADFAREALFDPLGIRRFEWAAGHDGVASAASGLRLTAPDLTKIGQLVLAKGLWGGHRIVAKDWIDPPDESPVSTGDDLGYRRLWFHGEAPVPALGGARRWIAGFGNGGQRLWLLPELGISAVIFSGNYNQWDAWVTPTRIWREIVLANFR